MKAFDSFLSDLLCVEVVQIEHLPTPFTRRGIMIQSSLFTDIYPDQEAGPIAERSKSSDLDCGRGDPGSNPGEGMCFFRDGELSGSHIVCFHTW